MSKLIRYKKHPCPKCLTQTNNKYAVYRHGPFVNTKLECENCGNLFMIAGELEKELESVTAEGRSTLFKPLSHGKSFFIGEGKYRTLVGPSKYTLDPDWRDYGTNRIDNTISLIEALSSAPENEDGRFNKFIEEYKVQLEDLLKKREEAKLRLIERGELDVNDL